MWWRSSGSRRTCRPSSDGVWLVMIFGQLAQCFIEMDRSSAFERCEPSENLLRSLMEAWGHAGGFESRGDFSHLGYKSPGFGRNVLDGGHGLGHRWAGAAPLFLQVGQPTK